MLINCDKCGAKYRIKPKKQPSKSIKFKCGKCSNFIKISAEEIAAKASAAKKPEKVKAVCSECGNSFLKPVSKEESICEQCLVDSLVKKVKDKYGVASAKTEPAAAPATAASDDVRIPDVGKAAPEPRYTIRSADGLVLGPIKLKTVKVLAREQRVKGLEEVSVDDGEYKPFMDYPELAELFPELRELIDTDGLEDKVDEAFSSAFADTLDEEAAVMPTADESEPPPAEPEAPEEAQAEPPEETEAPEEAPEEPEEEEREAAPEQEAPGEPEEASPEQEESDDEDAIMSMDDIVGIRENSIPASQVDEEELIEIEASASSEPEEEPPRAEESVEQQEEVIEIAELKKAREEDDAKDAETPDKEPAVSEEEVGTEFDIGQEWSEESSDEPPEIIEDLKPVSEPPPDARYKIRYPDGMILGPVKLGTIKELYNTGNLTGQEDVQRESEEWARFTDLPELIELAAEQEDDDDEEVDVVELTDVLDEA